jgi:hypothetical protein
MPTKHRAILFFGLFAALIGFPLFLKQPNPAEASDDPVPARSGSSNNTSSKQAIDGSAGRTKASSRLPMEEPDYGETLQTLRTVIPGLTDLPEQTLRERILAINAMLKKHDLALRFGVDEILYPSNHLLELKVPAFSKENASPRDILRHDVNAIDKHYFISGYKVLFQDGSGG